MAISTNIKNYATAHGKGEGGGGGGTTIIMGNINNNDLPDNINVGSITAENGNIDYLNGKSLSYNDGGFIYISANDGTIAKLRGDEISYKDGVISRLQSDEITTGKLKADEAEIDKATINTINSKNITTEYLTVTKQAHFFELIVDKIRSVGGTTIQTAANCVIDWVKAYDANDNEVALDANDVAYYNVYWRATEPSGRQITNDWKPFDQAICQSFNNVSAGVNYDISNKYYWRLVTELLPDTYMNINTGATTTQANAGVNSVQITNRTITYKDYQDADQTLVNKFDIVAQTIPNVQTGASWNSSTETMTTTNTVFGIQLTSQSDLDNIVPTKFSFDCSSARLSVGIYYVDSTSQYFPAPDIAQTHYEYDLNTDNNIEAIIITNADEVQWHLVHGITLSNTDKDANLSGSSSIPSKGDNIAQLGYRWNANGADANDKKRASAIIIAAYQTPDSELTAPSYAQYQNITDYDLSSHRGTYMDANGSKFIGDFWIDNDTSIINYIDSHAPTYNLYTAYATTADYGQQRITSLSDSTGCQYMGICPTPAATQPTNFNDYSWIAIQGNQGPVGPQGPAGQDGSNAIQYVLADQGSVATVVASLDSNNNVAKQLSINLRYKVVVIEGATARYATMQEMRDFPRQTGTDDGCYAYVKMSLDQNNANYRYIKMSLNTNDSDTSDALFTFAREITNEYVINTNEVLVIALINYNAINSEQDSIPVTSTNLQYTLYTTNMQITLAPSASLRIIQGDHASISTLVTGQEQNTQDISQLQQTASQISSTVSSHTTEINDINGDITNINNDISQIQQTSTSIISKVENLNAGSKNYFNYTYTQFAEGAVPYIQGYGLEVKGTTGNSQRYSQVNNLDFDEKGGDFSVTCWMRMQSTDKNVLVGLCNTNPNNITTNDGRVTVTTTWQKYSFNYNVTDANTNVQNVNGHITFSLAQGDSFTDTNRLYVKYLMITRGNIPSDFNLSWRDYDSVMTKQDALIVSDDMWNYRSNLNKTANKFKGYDIYECAGSTVSSDTNYVDVINISGIQVKQNKIYTLSFYAKTNGSSSINNTAEATGLGRNAYMYNANPIYSAMGIDEASRQEDINNPIGHPSKGNKSDGATNYKLNNSWQQFIIHWYNQNSVLSSFIAMRLFGQESTTISLEPFSIAGVEVREGWWDVDGINSSSMIKQTADEIELKVKNTGINIDDGTITLSADNTFVDGNLVLKYNEGAQGLIFRNSSNQDGLKISTSNLPQLSTWLNEYPGYPKLDVATNGFGFQSGSRYLYASTSDLALHDGSAGGVNNEYQIDVTLRQDGGNIGQIKDYIGQTEFGSNDNNTAYVKFLASETMVQHNGVRIIQPAQNYNYSNFKVTSKDKILLCAPNGNKQTSSDSRERAVTLNFPSNCVGHYYFIKRLYDVGRIYINGYVYAGTLNLSNTPMHNPYIDDNGLWMAIIVDGLDSTYNGTQIILNKIANNDRPNID